MFEESRVIRNDRLDILFEAVIEATEEAIISSLFAAETVIGKGNVRVESLPVEKTLEILQNMITQILYGRIILLPQFSFPDYVPELQNAPMCILHHRMSSLICR